MCMHTLFDDQGVFAYIRYVELLRIGPGLRYCPLLGPLRFFLTLPPDFSSASSSFGPLPILYSEL